jgi:hypothetical protein
MQQFLKSCSRQFPNDPVITVRSDRGGEFGNPDHAPTASMRLLTSQGIRHEFSSTESPEQNRRAERWIQTLGNMIRTMLVASGHSKCMWHEALRSATHVLNRTPSTVLPDHQSRYMCFTNKHPPLTHLRAWSCVARPPECGRAPKPL